MKIKKLLVLLTIGLSTAIAAAPATASPIIFNGGGPDQGGVLFSDANNGFRLQKLPEKAKAWTEEESRKNFAQVSALVTPGSPDKSHLLMYPLAPEAGGSIYHSGGRQFRSKDDPQWQTMAAWVKGAKLAPAADKK